MTNDGLTIVDQMATALEEAVLVEYDG